MADTWGGTLTTLEPTAEDEEIALRLRDLSLIDRSAAVHGVWQLDVYRARRVMVALLDLHADTADDEHRRQWGR